MRSTVGWFPGFLASAAAALVVGTAASGHGMFPQSVPVDRVIANLTQQVKDHPEDAEGFYRLGRAHTLALETRSGFVPAFVRGDSTVPAEGFFAQSLMKRGDQTKEATPEQLRTHLTEAIRNLNKAIAMRPTDAPCRLTLACALEAGAPYMNDVDAWPLCPAPSVLGHDGTVDRKAYSWHCERFDAIPREGEVISSFIQDMRDNSFFSVRDVVMTLAYEHRDKPEFKNAVAKLRQEDWRALIEDQYFTAMCYALPRNGRATEKPMWGGMENWVSYEAGADFIRVVSARNTRPSDAIRLKVAKETIAAFDALPPPRGITPIVIDLAGRNLASLESSKTVTFDLMGTDSPQRWTWLSPEAGLLVWDPDRTGKITSGRQLFGSASWWIGFENGYQALDALDDDRDGELAGSELGGIAVWFDRDSDGASDPGEVTPAGELGIAAIACRATGLEGDSPMNPRGLRMMDGRVLPTFDWIAKPAADGTSDDAK